MKDFSEESKFLASLAVFRELYDSQKDVYAIIAEFLNDTIVSGNLHKFSLTEISNLLNTTYDFNLPEAVVKSSLKRLDYLTKEKGFYIKDSLQEIKKHNIDQKQAEVQKSNDAIFHRLFTFIESEKGAALNDEEKTAAVHSFCSFLLDSTSSKNYYEYISAFLIKHKDDADFTSQIRQIKEGIILYSGIKYTNDLTAVGSWKTDLTIFADTEILFHLAGYNGELNQTLFNDFFKYVKEINQKNNRRTIQIKYFREVKEEIEGFFKKAEYIVAGAAIISPKGTAMPFIVNGCASASDVIAKKAAFFQMLTANGIVEDDYPDYYEEKKHKFNIVDKTVIDNITKATGIEGIAEHIAYLNFVNIRRGNSAPTNFENAGYVLLTGNYKTIQVAWHDDIKSFNYIPLATTLDFLTNKFWYKLNKGFGNNNYPKSFDVITKAQRLLSSQLNESVVKKFEDLQNQFKRGNLTEPQVIATIVELRKLTKKPEEIGIDDVDSILETLTEGSIERYIQEQDYLRAKAAREAEENEKLRLDLALKELEIQSKESEYLKETQQKNELQSNLKAQTIQLQQTILDETILSRIDLENHKAPIDRLAARDFLLFKVFILISLLCYYSFIFYLIYCLTWSVMEPWTYCLGSFPVIGTFVYLLFYERDFNLFKFLERKKQQFYSRKYSEFNFDMDRLSDLSEKEKVLKNQIKILTDELHVSDDRA